MVGRGAPRKTFPLGNFSVRSLCMEIFLKVLDHNRGFFSWLGVFFFRKPYFLGRWAKFLHRFFFFTAEFSHFLVTKKNFFVVTKKWVNSAVKFFLGNFLSKNGTTVVIIWKICEVMKSCIIILSVDCNTHLHTLSKKQKKFE